jgi:hypothetical protein
MLEQVSKFDDYLRGLFGIILTGVIYAVPDL